MTLMMASAPSAARTATWPEATASVTPPHASVPLSFFFLKTRPPPTSTLFPYTALFRSKAPRIDAASKPATTSGCASSDHATTSGRSDEHTSELQSPCNLVYRLLLEQ